MSRRARGAALLLSVLLGLAALAAGCDDEEQRRSEAALRMRSGDVAEVLRGKGELEAFLAKHPNDRVALYALGSYHERLGHTDQARLYYERLVGTNRDCEEVGRANDFLARLAAASSASAGTARASAAPPALSPPSPPSPPEGPLAVVPGRGVGELLVGAVPADPARPYGPCDQVREIGEASLCVILSRGLEVELVGGKIRRVGVYREGREVLTETSRRLIFRGFQGKTKEGVTVGMSEAEAMAKLGPPSGRRLPRSALVGADASVVVELFDYPRRGLTLEIDVTARGRVIGGIDIPTVEGRPVPVGPDPGKP